MELSGDDSGEAMGVPQIAHKRQRCKSGPAAGSGGKASLQKAARSSTQPSLLPRTSQPAASSASASDSGSSSSASESGDGSVFSAASESSSGGTNELSEVADSQEEPLSAQKPARKARKVAPAAKRAPQAAERAAQAGSMRVGTGAAPGSTRRAAAAAKTPAGAAKAAAETPALPAGSSKPGGSARKLRTPCAASAPAGPPRAVLAPCSNSRKSLGFDASAPAAPCAPLGAQGVTPAGHAKPSSAARKARSCQAAREGARYDAKGVPAGAETSVAGRAAPASPAGAKGAPAAGQGAAPAVTRGAMPGGTPGILGALPFVRAVGLMKSAPRSGQGLGGVRLPRGPAFRVPGLRRSAPGDMGLHKMPAGNP